MTTRRPTRIAAIATMVVLGGCHEAPRAAQAASVPPPGPDEIRLDTSSGKLAYIRVELPTLRRERVIASLPAQVAMNEDRTVRVLTPVSGRIASLDAAQGDEVAPGAPLAHIVSADLAQAASDFAKARAIAAQARAALARVEDLYQHHVAALKDVEQARSDDQQTEAELTRARARITALGADGGGPTSQYVLRAPIGGVVVDRAVNPGAEVRPDAATSLFTITSLDVVWLTASVYQRDLAAIHRGAKLRFRTDAVPGHEFEAIVTYVSGTLDPQTRTAVVRATLSNVDHLLRPLESGTARVLAPNPSPVLAVPTRALVTHGDRTVVFVEIAPGHYMRRVVAIGDDDGNTSVILSGVGATDRIVVDGSLLLEGEGERAQ